MRRWPLGLATGVLAGAFGVSFVLSGPPSPGPQGWALAVDLVWLGGVYGVVDALLLSWLPVHAVWRATAGWPSSWPVRILQAGLAVAASVVVTVAYHLGFPEFRGREVVQSVIGNRVLTLAHLASGSPVAPVLARPALHVAAILHAYETSIPRRPMADAPSTGQARRAGDRERSGSGLEHPHQHV